MLSNALGGGGVSDFVEKSITKMHGSTLLMLRRGGCQISRKKTLSNILNGPCRLRAIWVSKEKSERVSRFESVPLHRG